MAAINNVLCYIFENRKNESNYFPEKDSFNLKDIAHTLEISFALLNYDILTDSFTGFISLFNSILGALSLK